MAEKVLIQKYRERETLLKALAQKLEESTAETLLDMGRVDRITFGVKGSASFASKAEDPQNSPPYGDPFVEIEDQVRGRIIVFFLQDIETVKERLRDTFTNVESKYRRPLKDAEFGYESHHLICLIPPHMKPNGWADRDDLPKTFEIQIRTLFMHAWAEPQHDLAYKGLKDLPPNIRRELAWTSASAWGADQAFLRVWKWQSEIESTDRE